MRTFRKPGSVLNGLPYVSIVFCSLFGALAYMGINSGSGKVFNWFANMTSVRLTLARLTHQLTPL